MPYARSQRECPTCGRLVLAERRACNNLAHAVLTLFLCGFWLPIWALAILGSWMEPWHCLRCGEEV